MAIIYNGFALVLSEAGVPLAVPPGNAQPTALRFVGAAVAYESNAIVLSDGTRIAGAVVTLGPAVPAFGGYPLPLGSASSGEQGNYARGDHAHPHGDQAGGSLHDLAVAGGAAGFMSGADKTKLDGIAAGATIVALNVVAPITSTGGGSPTLGISAATTTDPGSMSAADKLKADRLTVAVEALSLQATSFAVVDADTTEHFKVTYDAGPPDVTVTTANNPLIFKDSGTLSLDPLAYTYIKSGGVTVLETDVAKVTITGEQIVTGRSRRRTTQGGGWRDLLGPFTPPSSGATIPVLSLFGTTGYRKPLWALNDIGHFEFHVPHSYAVETDVHFHVHWARVGTAMQTVKWQIEYSYARGYGLAAFPVAGSGTIITVEAAPGATTGTHEITESVAQTIVDMEPDGYIFAKLTRVTNGGVNNADDIFAWAMDIHHQSVENDSENRNGPWNT